jgi:hypothetical protein
MQSWIVVLTLFYQTPAIATPPGLYESRERCEAAARAFEARNQKTDLVGVTLEAFCIPGPTVVLAPPVKK